MKRWLIGLTIIVVSGLAITIAWRQRPVRQAFYTDANTIKAPADTAPLREILWKPPEQLPDIINTGDHVYEGRMSADGMTLFFVRGKAGHNAGIYTARRTPDGWTDPTEVTGVNSKYDDLGPEPSADGKLLYFYSNRPAGFGGYDLWVAQRPPDGRSGFGEPINLGPGVNSNFNDYGPALSADGGTLYFSSNRPAKQDVDQPDPNAWQATLREDLYTRTYDLYTSVISEHGVGKAKPLTTLNTPYNEGAPAVSPVEDFLYFSSDRPGGEGAFDLYRSRRLLGEHRPPTNLGSPVNTFANELDPGLSVEGYALFFSSDRATGQQSDDGTPVYHLYRTSSREVFRDIEVTEKPPIDWAGLWSGIGPNLFWILLALLLALLLFALMGHLRRRQLSLLARCLLASLLAHLLLLLLLNVWEVTAAIGRELRKGGEIRVALASPSSGGDISAQLLGRFTEVDTPEPIQTSTPRQIELVAFQSAQPAIRIEVERRPIEFNDPQELILTAADAPAKTLPEITEPDVSFTQVDTLLALEPALPKTQTLPVEDEPQPIEQLEPQELQPLDRPNHAVAPMTKAMIALELSPASSERSAHDENVSSIADQQPPSEALPALQKIVTPTPKLADLEYSPTEELALNVPTGDRLPEFDEHQPDINPARETRIRPDWSAQTDPDSARDIPQQLDPEPIPADQAHASLASIDTDRATQVLPELPAVASFTGASLEAMPPPNDFALPPLEESSAAPTMETALHVETPTGDTPRPTVTALQDHQSFDLTTRQFDVSALTLDDATRRSLVDPQLDLRDAAQRLLLPIGLSTRTDFPPAATHALELDLNLNLPTEEQPPQNPYAQRSREQRMDVVNRRGGSEETERAVENALNWLARHQSNDGHWDADGFDDRCGQCGGESTFEVNHALTGLATLCFLGSGHTHVMDGPYRENVARALSWLKRHQRPDGDLRGHETMYSHGIATIALSEAHAMTHDADLTDAVRAAAQFIYRARNRRMGGWRYDPGQSGDTSVLGWQVMALKSASIGGINVPREAFQTAKRWLDVVSDPSQPGRYAYRPGRDPTPSMTAEAMFVQQLLGRGPDGPGMQESAQYIARYLPDWGDDPNTYFWYYATLALFQHQGEQWQRWNKALSRQLLAHQEKVGSAAGSWVPDGEWAHIGGGVYQTALCTLMLEVYYRYLPLYLIEPASPHEDQWLDDAVGTLRGVVTDAATGRPVPGAAVWVDLADHTPMTATTDQDGLYLLRLPEMPDFFAVSGSRTGYVPGTQNVRWSQLQDTKLTLDFNLQPLGNQIVVTEIEPRVHHLGDDSYDGRINSQFQKQSEGTEFETQFRLTPEQLMPYFSKAEVRMLTKGVQRRHKIFLNGRLLARRLESAPGDGSFGEFRAPFNPELLRSDINTLRIVAAPSTTDVDDFEFVNVQLHLSP